MTIDLPNGNENAPRVPRGLAFREYVWFSVVLLVLVAARALETQSP